MTEGSMYEGVRYEDVDGYPVIVLEGQSEDGTLIYHEIPLQAIADRMELFGLESAEQTLEYIGREAHNPETADTLYAPIQGTYREVVESEFAQTLMTNPRVEDRSRQTLMAPMAIAPFKREKLREIRGESLQILGMESMIHSEPAARMMDSSRPTERTAPAAATALRAEEGVIAKAVTLIQEHSNVVQDWRVETACSYVPQLRKYLEQLAESGD